MIVPATWPGRCFVLPSHNITCDRQAASELVINRRQEGAAPKCMPPTFGGKSSDCASPYRRNVDGQVLPVRRADKWSIPGSPRLAHRVCGTAMRSMLAAKPGESLVDRVACPHGTRSYQG